MAKEEIESIEVIIDKGNKKLLDRFKVLEKISAGAVIEQLNNINIYIQNNKKNG